MNEQEKELADYILKQSKSSIKNVAHYLTLMKAVELRIKMENQQKQLQLGEK